MRLFLPVAHTCLEYAVNQRIQDERQGTPAIAKLAASEILKGDPFHWRASSRGWISIWWLLRRFPDLESPGTAEIMRRFQGFDHVLNEYEELIKRATDCEDAKSLTKLAEYIYKKVITRYFAPKHDLDPLPEWLDPEHEGNENDDESNLADPEKKLGHRLIYGTGGKKLLTDLGEEDLALIPEYIRRNFGPSFKTSSELKKIENELCTGIHEDRKLHFTDGIPRGNEDEEKDKDRVRHDPARESLEANMEIMKENEAVVSAGIRGLETAFRNMLKILSDPVYRR
jgi:hypothetical protein